MAKAGYTSICLVLLATFAQSGLGFGTLANPIGSIHMLNDGHYNMTIQTTVHYKNGGSRTDPSYSPLPVDTAFQFEVLEGMDCVSTSFRMATPSGQYNQSVADWCSIAGSMPIACLPNCFWLVDETYGFSVANSGYAIQQFVTGWNGPHQA